MLLERFVAMKRTLGFLPFILLFCISGCNLWSGGASVPDTVVLGDTTGTQAITGTVKYIQIEGGFWAIVGEVADTDASETYKPTNLPDSYKVDGQRVHVRAIQRDDLFSIHMVGPIIEIRRIEPRH